MRSLHHGAQILVCETLLAASLAACIDALSPAKNVSLEGTYTLQSFTAGVQDLSAVSTGTAVLTDSTYKLNIAFAGNVAPAIVDSGRYTAKSNGTFSETSAVTGAQTRGTYKVSGNVWSVLLAVQGVAIAQSWVKQP